MDEKVEYYENGEITNGSMLVLSFPSSNAAFTQLCRGENTECLLEGLVSIFEHIGGVPEEIWFDNMSSAVTGILTGGGRTLTENFQRFSMHYNFNAVFCNPAKGNEKAIVSERNVSNTGNKGKC